MDTSTGVRGQQDYGMCYLFMLHGRETQGWVVGSVAEILEYSMDRARLEFVRFHYIECIISHKRVHGRSETLA